MEAIAAGALLLAGMAGQVTAGQVIAAAAPLDQRGAAVLAPDAAPAQWLWLVPFAAVALLLILVFRWHRLGAALRAPALFPPETSVVLALAIYGAGLVGGVAARLLLASRDPAPPDEAPSIPALATVMLAVYAAQSAAALVYVHRSAAVPRADRPASGRAALLGLAAIALAWPLVTLTGTAAATMIERLGGPPAEPVAHETLRLLHESALDAWFFLVVLLVVVVAPILEEVIYRGLIQDALRRRGLRPWAAIAVASVVFALMHLGSAAPHAVAAIFVLSLAFGWARERTGGLVAPITMHAAFNLLNIVLARWSEDG
jgi:membrane protease YdiL (CAAX protease family)